MMRIHTFPLGELQANCYIIEKNSEVIIIDPGDSAEFIGEFLQRNNLVPLAILATHGHFDHVMAVGELQAMYPGLTCYIHETDEFLLARLETTAKHFLQHVTVVLPPQEITYVQDGQELHLLGLSIRVMHIPGHTPGSVAYVLEEEKVVFSGDIVFAGGGVGRYDFAYSNKNDLYTSIEKIKALDDDYVIYPGHGESFN